MHTPVTPGLLILHGNQMEQLRAAVFQWLRQHPLAPLETDIFLVQSNGVAEWLKIALAEEMGVCAATRVALPARLLWESLPGHAGARARAARVAVRQVPADLASDAPVAVAAGRPRLRAAAPLPGRWRSPNAGCSWPSAWPTCSTSTRSTAPTGWPIGPRGATSCARRAAKPSPLTDDQRWQAQLWRAVAATSAASRARHGPRRHPRRIPARRSPPAMRRPAGCRAASCCSAMSALPYQTLQALAALARHTQVVLAVPNPCQFYWGDIIDGRDLLRAAHKRQPQRKGIDLAHDSARRTACAQPSAAGQLGQARARFHPHARRIRRDDAQARRARRQPAHRPV